MLCALSQVFLVCILCFHLNYAAALKCSEAQLLETQLFYIFIILCPHAPQISVRVRAFGRLSDSARNSLEGNADRSESSQFLVIVTKTYREICSHQIYWILSYQIFSIPSDWDAVWRRASVSFHRTRRAGLRVSAGVEV